MNTSLNIPAGTAPASPLPGDAWRDTSTGKMYVIDEHGKAIEHIPDPVKSAEIRDAIRNGRIFSL